MIDIENAIIDRITEAVLEVSPDANVYGDYVEEIISLPTVTVTEINNETLSHMQDNLETEHYATVTYEVNIYVNDQVGKKTRAKDILKAIDGVMIPLNFVRRPTRRLFAINNTRTVLRLYARYQAIVEEATTVVGENGEETTIHYLYRR